MCLLSVILWLHCVLKLISFSTHADLCLQKNCIYNWTFFLFFTVFFWVIVIQFFGVCCIFEIWLKQTFLILTTLTHTIFSNWLLCRSFQGLDPTWKRVQNLCTIDQCIKKHIHTPVMYVSTIQGYLKRSTTELLLLVQTVVVLCVDQVRSDILSMIQERGGLVWKANESRAHRGFGGYVGLVLQKHLH